MCVLCLQRLGKEVNRPESAVAVGALGRPGPLWVAIETMDQYNVYLGARVGVDSCDVEAGNLPIDGPLRGVESENEAIPNKVE